MLPSRYGRWPARRPSGRRLLVLVPPLLVLGGCAHTDPTSTYQTSYAQQGYYAGAQSLKPPAPIPVEMEEDGRPPQLPPRVGVASAPDDPTQPWSPNYGGPARQPPRTPASDPNARPAGQAAADQATTTAASATVARHHVAWADDPE